MKSFKDSSFQERLGRAAEAKRRALEQLLSRPPLDAQVMAERMAASQKLEANRTDRAAAMKAAKATAAAEASAKAVAPPPLTEAERKDRRDARYAARKSRK